MTPTPEGRDWSRIVESLLSLSREIESRASRFRPDTVHTLDLLGSLATTARQSLQEPSQTRKPDPSMTALPTSGSAAPAEASAAGSALGSAPGSSPKSLPVSYGTGKPEYEAALQDRSLIDALLEFHRKSRETQGLLRPLTEFAPQELERIEARPKARPLGSRNGVVGVPILRSPRP